MAWPTSRCFAPRTAPGISDTQCLGPFRPSNGGTRAIFLSLETTTGTARPTSLCSGRRMARGISSTRARGMPMDFRGATETTFRSPSARETTAETMTDELWQRSACDLADGIRQKKYSCREAMESVVRRIDARNPALNAIVFDYTKDAIAEASRADEDLAAGRPRGPLHGVPITIKENV